MIGRRWTGLSHRGAVAPGRLRRGRAPPQQRQARSGLRPGKAALINLDRCTLPTRVVIHSLLPRFDLSESDGKIDLVNYFEIMSKVEGSTRDDWTKVEMEVPTVDGYRE